jgi:peptide/nickel transport system permease protein
MSADAARSPRVGSVAVALYCAVLAVVAAGALLAPVLPFPDPNAVDLASRSVGPFSADHFLGTDALGRDLLSRSLHGARVSLLVATSVTLAGLAIGGLVGVAAGLSGPTTSSAIVKVLDIMLAFPALVLALAIATYLGPSIPNLILAILFSVGPAYARLARTSSFSVRNLDFVRSARLMGASRRTIATRHVIPNILPTMLAFGLATFGLVIIIEASLSFLGLGIRPPTPSWGVMISEGRADLETAPHIVLVPGVLLFVTVLSVNLLTDELQRRNAAS